MTFSSQHHLPTTSTAYDPSIPFGRPPTYVLNDSLALFDALASHAFAPCAVAVDEPLSFWWTCQESNPTISTKCARVKKKRGKSTYDGHGSNNALRRRHRVGPKTCHQRSWLDWSCSRAAGSDQVLGAKSTIPHLSNPTNNLGTLHVPRVGIEPTPHGPKPCILAVRRPGNSHAVSCCCCVDNAGSSAAVEMSCASSAEGSSACTSSTELISKPLTASKRKSSITAGSRL